MLDHPQRIPIDDCQVGNVYVVLARNFNVGVCRHFDDDQFHIGFLGIREKRELYYIQTEYHWDCGSPFGTANPLTDLGPLPDEIAITSERQLFDWLYAQRQPTPDELFPPDHPFLKFDPPHQDRHVNRSECSSTTKNKS